MTSVFVSYRRVDSQGITSRLVDRLIDFLGERTVFRDIYDIAPGADFTYVLREALRQCAIVLPVIGQRWVKEIERRAAKHETGDTDWVRFEIATALQTNKLIIPILVNEAILPSAQELPPDLQALAALDPITLHETTFEQDIEKIAKRIIDSPVGKAILQTALCELLNFTPEDLTDNRQQKLSKAQLQLLGGWIYMIVAGFSFGLGVLFLAGVVSLVWVGASLLFVCPSILMALSVLVIALAAFNMIRHRRISVINGNIHMLNKQSSLFVGEIELSLSYLNVSPLAFLLMKDRQFRVYYRQYAALPFFPPERNLLSVEIVESQA